MMDDVVLGAHSLLVRGVKRTALYDVARQSCIRLPNHVFEDVLYASGRPGERIESLRGRLLSLGYLAPVSSTESTGGFDLGPRRALLSPTAVLSVDAAFLEHGEAPAFLQVMAQLGQSQHLIVEMGDSALSVRARRTLQKAGLGYELSDASAAGKTRAIFDRYHKHIGNRLPARSGRLSRRFRFDYQTLLRNRHSYEGYGLVHLRGDGSAWPNAREQQFCYGTSGDVERGALLASSVFQEICSSSKDVRDVCCGCEFRLACNWSISARCTPTNLKSAPDRCGYDPSLDDAQDANL